MPSPDLATEHDLGHYLRVLRRRRLTIALAFEVVVGTALGAALLESPMYAATAEVLLRPNPSEVAITAGQQNTSAKGQTIATEIRLLQSKPVRDRVRAEIGVAPAVRATQLEGTEFIAVRAEHRRPESAAQIANTYAKEFIDYRRDQTIEGYSALSARLTEQIAHDEGRIDELNGLLAFIDPIKGPTTTERQLLTERDSLQRTVSTKSDSLEQLRADAEAAAGAAQLVTPASAASQPFKPAPLRTGVLAAIIGLCFGIGLAFFVDFLDDSVKSREDIERHTGGVPLVGLVPAVPGWKDRERAMLISHDQPASVSAEAYRSIRTAIQFLALDKAFRTLQVTSPAAREGKTTTLANLAVALAAAGKRVCVVCCDLRRPRVHEFFGLSNEFGFTSVVLGDAQLSTAVQPVPAIPRLFLLASGPLPPNPAELLGTSKASAVLQALQEEFDMILIDCPPVLPVTDAAVVSHLVDATLLVATAGTTSRRALGLATGVLRQVDAPLIGTVLNGISGQPGYGYGSSYEYYGKRPSSETNGNSNGASTAERTRRWGRLTAARDAD
jgi:capsular exopolysaccharide synthesis family protein